jgi:hypothetical protein
MKGGVKDVEKEHKEEIKIDQEKPTDLNEIKVEVL